jgi:hypothetical protein
LYTAAAQQSLEYLLLPVLLSVLHLLLMALQVINRVRLTPDGGSAQESPRVAVPFIVQCDASLGLQYDAELHTEDTSYVSSHSIQAGGPSDVQLSWGSAASAAVPARVTFQRSVASVVFRAAGQLLVKNNGDTIAKVQSMQLQCPWASSIIPVLCSGMPNFDVAPHETRPCTVNERVPGDWSADTSQLCTITAEVQGSFPIQQAIKLDFKSAPKGSGSQSKCARWSVTCSQPVGGTNNWQAAVTSNASVGQELCGGDDNKPVVEETIITWNGTWTGPGDQPGDCATPVAVSMYFCWCQQDWCYNCCCFIQLLS